MHARLAELGVSPSDPELGVVVVAIGSTHVAANARTANVASTLIAGTQWAAATTAFATGSGPSPAEAVERLRHSGARRLVIAPWFLAPGRLTDRVLEYAAAQGIPMAAPLGSHRLVAETVLDRFDTAVAEPLAAWLEECAEGLETAARVATRWPDGEGISDPIRFYDEPSSAARAYAIARVLNGGQQS